jgi:hypothetical protein
VRHDADLAYLLRWADTIEAGWHAVLRKHGREPGPLDIPEKSQRLRAVVARVRELEALP